LCSDGIFLRQRVLFVFVEADELVGINLEHVEVVVVVPEGGLDSLRLVPRDLEQDTQVYVAFLRLEVLVDLFDERMLCPSQVRVVLLVFEGRVDELRLVALHARLEQRRFARIILLALLKVIELEVFETRDEGPLMLVEEQL